MLRRPASAPRRGELRSPAGYICYRPYACADGYVTLGALEPKFWQAWCRGRRARGPDRARSSTRRAPTRTATVSEIFARSARASSGARSPPSTTAAWSRCSTLDEALDSELVAAREMVVELDQPGAEQPVRLLGVPIKLSRTPGDPARAPGPGARRAHRRGAGARRALGRGDRALHEAGAVAGPARTPCRARSWRELRWQTADGMLKMSELAERSGVSAGTIKHYLREGLLGSDDDGVRTSPQHGLLPAGVRAADPADQAPPGGAVHAAARDPRA